MPSADALSSAIPSKLRAVAAALLLIGAASREARSQARPDSVRGRVTTDSGAVIPGADVIVTIAPTVNTVRQTTDSAGRYALAIPDGTGEYILYIGAGGRKPFRQRLTRTGRDTTFVVNAQLASAITTLATVKVAAKKPRPPSSASTYGFGTTGTDKTVDGVYGALPPDLATSTDAMASLIPGLSVGPGGVSAFGMTSDANNATLNGMTFSGGDLPRDARTTTRFSTSPWDPTLGGFAGVLVRQTLASGGNISSRSSHLTIDDPALQFSDPIAAHVGQEFSNIALDLGGRGAYALDKLYYNYGVHVARRTSAVASLADLNPAALSLSGVSADSAQRLLQVLAALGIPSSVAGVSPYLTTTSATFTERVDHLLPTVPFGSVPLPTWSLTAFATYSRSDPTGLQTSAPATVAGTRVTESAMLQGGYVRYFGSDGQVLNEFTTALSYSDARGTPYLGIPGGNVLISSLMPDGSTTLGSVAFGGNGAFASDSKSWSWETVNTTSFLGGGLAELPMKLYVQSRFDGFDLMPSTNRYGTFTFPSLAALDANQPSTFSRTLNAPSAQGTEWTGAAALGGTWTHGKLTLTGGLRVDANTFLTKPAENPAIASAFGRRTDQVPDGFALSPRVGFTYQIPGNPGYGQFMSQTSSLFRGQTQIRGGFGVFRGTARPALIAGPLTGTGLPGGIERLLCTGSAAPTPNWSVYDANPTSIPSSCVNTTTLADTAPAVTLFDHAWAVPASYRTSLGVTKVMLGTYFTLDANYSLNVNQPSSYDLNFDGTPRFSLADEGGRPVYVSPSSIDPASGAVSSVAARSVAAYGSVLDRMSDLQGDTRQLVFYAIPNLPFKLGVVTIGYTYSIARAQSRGFDLSTSGDPRLVEWSAGLLTPRHVFQVGIAKQFGRKWGLTTSIRAQSGLPFTPLVGGDINGDGAGNDRAFVFDPATAADAGVASDMRTLMASGSPAARSCLNQQIGKIAGLNSCTGPWSATMNAGVFIFPTIPYTSDRARVSFTLYNLLGGLDEVIHGNNHLQGWGAAPLPDPVLLRVRGFDQASNTFLYDVNPRFGSTSLLTTAQRVPFRVTLDVSIDVGHSSAEQELDQNLRLRPSLVGTHAPVDSVKSRYMTRNFSDFFGFLLVRMKDSLALTNDQMRQMQDEREALRRRADTIYTHLAEYLVSLPDGYDRKAAIKKITDAGDQVWTEIDNEGKFLKQLLTSAQIRLLPSPIFNMIQAPDIHSRFFFGF